MFVNVNPIMAAIVEAADTLNTHRMITSTRMTG